MSSPGIHPALRLFDLMPQLGWTARADGYIDHYNARWYEYTGTTPAEMEGWGWTSVHHPDHLARVIAQWTAAIADGVATEIEFPLRRHDGVFRWFLTRVEPIRDERGAVIRWVGINTDVDDLRATREALQVRNAEASVLAAALEAQRARFQRLFAHAPVAIALLSGPDHVIELANPIINQLWGRTESEVLGKPLLDAVPELRGQGFDDLLTEVLQTGVPRVGTEVPAVLERGGVRDTVYFNFVYEPTRNAAGVIDGVIVVAVDVTPQVLARTSTEERARHIAFIARVGTSLTSADPLAVMLHSCCSAMVELGAAFARIWVYNGADDTLVLRASAGLYTHLDGAHSRVPVGMYKIGLIASEREPHLTNAVLDDPRVGDQAWAQREGMVAFAGYPLIVGDRLVGVTALFARTPLADDTLRSLGNVATQIALAIDRDHVDRFREVFIGMLGHDLRNPLSAIFTGAQALALNPELPERGKRTADRILRSAQRMSRMVDQLLDYTRARTSGGIPVVPVRGNVFAICRDVVDELRESNPGRVIEISTRGAGDGEWDVDRLSQVFSNLLGNAISYGHSDAPIRVDLVDDGASITGEVVSRGTQIPAADIPHLFDWLRRAHHNKTSSTKGLGLGLFITAEIIKSHGGVISVTSSADGVSRFCFELPLVSRGGRTTDEHRALERPE